MFIRKKSFQILLGEMLEQRKEIDNLKRERSLAVSSITSMRNDETDILFGFAESIAELQDKIADLSDFSEIAEAEKELHLKQLKHEIGLLNITDY